jgi:hypothetical protein
MRSRGREYVLKAAVGVWFVFAFAACSEKARDVGGESHFVCESDDDCDVDSVCVREHESSPRGECRPMEGVGGSGGSDGGGAGGSSGADDRGTGGIGGNTSEPEAVAQGAVAFKVSPTPGKVCSHTNGQLSAPFNVAGVFDALNCDLSAGCRPDEYVVVDRDRGTAVQCSVAPNGGSYTVSARILVDGSQTGEESLSFGLSGIVGPTGGNSIAVNQQNSVSGGGGIDNNCTVTINAPYGLIKTGAIWGHVRCDDFKNPTDISETGCTLDAVFLFENCGG